MLVSLCLYGKEKKIKFGKIEKSDLEMQVYEKDTSASAVILYEKGKSEIRYDQNNGWYLDFEKHVRIKILKKEGVKYGDFQIPLYKGSSDTEDVNSLKAITFNLENGKIVKSELGKKDVHKEEVNKYNNLESFSLPNVKVGSVIDVKYSIDCKTFFREMRPWKFQHNIPVVHSEYYVSIPEYFNFGKFVLGFETFAVSEESESPRSITYTDVERTGGGFDGVRTNISSGTIKYESNNYHWIANDLPAFQEESYLSTVENYVQQVRFELKTAQFPQSKLYNYSQSWESINRNLIEDGDFGKNVYGNLNFLQKDVLELTKDCSSDLEKVNNILNYVHSNYKFNDVFSIYSKGTRKVKKDRNGNVADLNLLLAAMLNVAGFDAKPVVLSTRANGLFLFPTVAGFNYVIVQCGINGHKVLLDAVNDFCGINQVPFYCLNGRGMVVGGKKPEWIDLLSVGKSKTNYASDLKIDNSGNLTGSLRINRFGYSALNLRQKISSFNSMDKYLDDYSSGRSDWEIESHSIEGKDDLNSILQHKIELSVNNAGVFAGDRIYISPVIFNPEKENPFKLKERKYPVDFGYKFEESEMSILTIPEGYEIEELPKSEIVVTPGQKAVYSFQVNKLGENKIQTVAKVDFKNSVFLPDDYENLKLFYNKIVEKQSQQIILKKL